MYLPNDILSTILDHRTKLMKEEKLKKIENLAHINFFNCMCEIEENIDDLVISIQFQLDDIDPEESEDIEYHLSTCNFSELLIEQVIINNCYREM